MGVTQVIRGSDHIGNTARQIAVFKNMSLALQLGRWGGGGGGHPQGGRNHPKIQKPI